MIRFGDVDVLIVGGGITGLTTATAFGRSGWDVTIVERAPGPRDAGYMIDFFGPGYTAAEQMGLLPDIARIHRQIDRLVFLGEDGSPNYVLDYPTVRQRTFRGRHFNFMRGDLEAVLRAAATAVADVRYGVTVAALDQDEGSVSVTLSDDSSAAFDLVVGADGLHSQVRRMLWGPPARFKLDLGHATAAFLLDRLPGGGNPDEFTTMYAAGRMAAVYPTADGRAAAFFVHRTTDAAGDVTRGAHAVLPEVYGDLGWVVPELLEAASSKDVYFDEVSQVRLDHWVDGRVALAGDAAWCVTLLAGQGASLGMAGGHSLAKALTEGADVHQALVRWEAEFRPIAESRQASGRTTAHWFVPTERWRMLVRDVTVRGSAWPWIGPMFARKFVGGRAR